jgi:hypothetical protein
MALTLKSYSMNIRKDGTNYIITEAGFVGTTDLPDYNGEPREYTYETLPPGLVAGDISKVVDAGEADFKLRNSIS